jgi:D-glycero-D-manno-heptose 1,7-bisphosphate phosphatase
MRFVFLDRDGTLIKLYDYLGDPSLVELLPSVIEALRLLQSHNLALAIVTNQSGVARGKYTLADMHACNEKTRDLLLAQGVTLQGIYSCPHLPADHCQCRKPLPGMIHQAMAQHAANAFDPALSFVVGDNETDLGLAKAIGAKGVLVTTGHGANTLSKLSTPPDYTAENLLLAARWIVSQL